MYYFEAYKDWEIDNSIFSLFEEAEKYRFPCIKISLNINIFFIDVIIPIEDEISQSDRFMFGSIRDGLNFIEQSNIYESAISILSRRCDNDGEYVVSDIEKVIQAEDESGQIAYIFYCKNERIYIDSLLAEKETDLTGFKTIYKCKY